MTFLCMYCNNPNPIPLTVIDYEYHASGSYGIVFLICPSCDNKLMVKIEDLGKIKK
jgi:hypothetical protein